MKISPVLIYSSKVNVLKQNRTVKSSIIDRVSDIQNIGFSCSAPFLGSLSYEYKPISSKKQNYGLIDGQYRNIDEFSELFSQKLNSQLLIIENEDIENLINRIKLKTKAPDNLIKEVLYNLTLLSGYNSIKYFDNLSKKISTNLFGVNPLDTDSFSDASLNTALNYLSSEKQIFSAGSNEKRIVVLDDNFLQEVEYAKYSKNPAYLDFINKAKNGEFVFLNLPSWDIKCLDGNYRSANFLLGTGFLEDIAIDTIKRINRGEKLENILYGDFEERFRKITDSTDISIHKPPIPLKTKSISTDDILNNIKTPSISKDEVKKLILQERALIEPKSKRKQFTKALCKFLDEFSIVYSTNSMASDLVQLHKVIKSKINSSQTSQYCIATDEKSPSYVTSIYAKLNNIDPFIITSCTNKDYYKLSRILHGKDTILLDDNSITGGSILGFSFDIPSVDTHWFVLLATNEAIEKLKDEKNKPIPKSFNQLRTLKNESNKRYSISESKLLNQSELELLKTNIGWGYEDSGVLCAFPYMIPDNCIDISAVLFDKLLFKNNPETNKPADGYCKRMHYVQNKPISFNGSYRPLSKIEPNYNILNCDYRDIDKFCELFANKINSQLRTIELSDIKALSERIQTQTGADINLIHNVLYQLTMFSGYSTFDYLQDIVSEYKSSHFGLGQRFDSIMHDVSSNTALYYLANNKLLIKKPETSLCDLIVLDGILLKQLENSKRQGTDFYKKFIKELQEGSIRLINLKGWDVECSDGIYRSSVFLYGSGQLEDLAIDTIKRIQNGENIDDILYSNIETKLKTIIGTDINKNKIKIMRYEPKTSQDHIGLKEVYSNFGARKLSADEIKKEMLYSAGYTCVQDEKVKHILELYAKYLDEFSLAYSFDSIASDLIELNKKIEQNHGSNLLYYICKSFKSYGLIAHLYAKVNNKNPDMFFDLELEKSLHDKIKRKTKYPTIILDDISASGKSIECQTHTHGFYRLANKGMTYNFGLLVASDKAQENFCNDTLKTGEMISVRNVKDLCVSDSILLSDEELDELSKLLIKGYGNVGISTVFPYIIPDNCSDLSARIFDKLLIKSNIHTNRVLI